MSLTYRKIIGLAGLILFFAGCSGNSTLLKKKSFEGGEVMLTSSDVRAITSASVGYDKSQGRIIPKQVTCAEPSPDVMKAIEKSFGLGIAAGGNVSGQGQGKVDASVAKAQAEAAAQLTERMATIQLLRDGLYRA